ncbi:galactokinase [Erysipelotrichaceae bacterium]|nr:galactokinase [Erysipelotrichaceae bacterium]
MERHKEKFYELFNKKSQKTIFSPGRINIIGEHIDYNGGNVFPAAIAYGTYLYFAIRDDKIINLYSDNFAEDGVESFEIDAIIKNENGAWTNFPKGILATMAKHGHRLTHGFDAYVYGTIPNASGLSSSASLEMAFALLVFEIVGKTADPVEMSKIAMEAENNFIGVQCGIMDMFAIGLGKKDHAILINCNTLEYKYAPCTLGKYTFLIMNTNKKRKLADSKYNERRLECSAALKRIQTIFEVEQLCELELSDLPQVKKALNQETLYRRVRHVVSEQKRTQLVFEALAIGDLPCVGLNLNNSHLSLKDDYEVTGSELDLIVQAAQKQAGVLGARMTGAGFGGCAIALIEQAAADTIKEAVQQAYFSAFGYNPTFYESKIVSGTAVI